MNKTLSLLLSLLVATSALVACGGGGDNSPVQAAATNTTAAASPTTAAAVVNTPFTFANGVPGFGTTAATTVAFTNTSTTPTFSVTSGGKTATGTTTFGSCHFKVTSSTFDSPPSPLVVGATVTVDPCSIVVDNVGQLANGACTTYNVHLLIGTTSSTGFLMTVCLSDTGQVTINGQPIGTVTVKPVTGT